MAAVMRMIKLGRQGLTVSQQGFGCMGMSEYYGTRKPDSEMIHVIHWALHLGITHLDTADIYGPYTNEILVGKALDERFRKKVQLATKCGAVPTREVRGDPAYVRNACEASLKRLNTDCIDLFYQHRIDTTVPIEVTMGEMKKLVDEGKIKYVGLSEASPSVIRRAHAVHPLSAIQLEWALFEREVEKEIVPTCRELGIGIIAYSPLARGFLADGPKLIETLADDDWRKNLPRFHGKNLEHNKTMYERLCSLAAKKECTPSQLALAWVHHQGDDVCPIPGPPVLTM